MANPRKPKQQTLPASLARRIPKAHTYIPRFITPDMTDLQLIEYAHESRFNLLISGPTGAGKTSALTKYAADKGLPMITVACDGAATPDKLFGKFVPMRDRSLRFIWGPVTLAARYGGLLMWDEINMLRPDTASVAHGMTDFRRQLELDEHPFTWFLDGQGWDGYLTEEEYEALSSTQQAQAEPFFGPATLDVNSELLIAATMNPNYYGTRPLNPAFANRWRPIDIDYSPEVEEQLVVSPVLRELAVALRRQHESGLIRTPVSTNRLVAFETYVEDKGYDTAKELFFFNFPPEEREVVRTVWNDAMERRLMNDYGYDYVK